MWIDYFDKNRVKPFFGFLKYIKRKDIQKLFLEQYEFQLPKNNPPSLFVMDSLSELVDKKFISKVSPKEYFFAYYSDVDNKILEVADNHDLLPIDQISSFYDDFFLKFRSLYPDCPIAYVFFPSKLENRTLFIDRALVINAAIKEIAKKHNKFYLFEVSEEIVEHDNNDSNPYHYCENVYKYLADNLSDSGLFIPFVKNNFQS